MKQRFEKREHQRGMWRHVWRKPYCLLFASLGSGKTGTVLDALNTLYMIGQLRPEDRVLIAAPKRVARISWPDEDEKFSWPNIRLAVAVGTEDERLAALRSNANVVTINYDVLPWLEQQPEADGFTVIVADECTRLSGFRGWSGQAQQSKALARLRKRNGVKRFVGLTATPGGLVKMWGMMWFCDMGKRLGRSFGAFAEKYFTKERVGKSQFAVKLVPRKIAFKQIMKRMADFTLTVDAVSIFGVDKPVPLDYWVELPPRAREQYDAMQSQAFIELENGDISEAANAGAAVNKCLQIANGAVYLTDEDGDATDKWAHIHDEKLDVLEEIVEKTDGENLIVVYQYRHDKDRILKRFPRAMLFDDKGKAKKLWDDGKLPMLVMHAASAGHGLSLQGDGRPFSGGRHMVFFGVGWGAELYEQVCGRCNPMRQKQAGYTDRTVFYHHIRARDTFDEAVKQAIDTGISMQQACLDYHDEHK